jgi:hypothetical protein
MILLPLNDKQCFSIPQEIEMTLNIYFYFIRRKLHILRVVKSGMYSVLKEVFDHNPKFSLVYLEALIFGAMFHHLLHGKFRGKVGRCIPPPY